MEAERGRGGLQKLVLKGLPDDDLTLHGWMTGVKDEVSQDFEQQEEPVLTWMGIDDIPLWNPKSGSILHGLEGGPEEPKIMK
ncbi:hypothetical protein MMC29_006259, partial [Sticta canariensis]|nr:hypothetical protein [Sticta canariensis]